MLALAVLSNTGASLILKWASLPQHRIESWSAPPALGQIAPLALALLISLAANAVLQESITPASLLGTVLIFLGVGVLMRAA